MSVIQHLAVSIPFEATHHTEEIGRGLANVEGRLIDWYRHIVRLLAEVKVLAELHKLVVPVDSGLEDLRIRSELRRKLLERVCLKHGSGSDGILNVGAVLDR